MSLMERRLQLLLDQERYDRVAGEAARSGRSVAAVIREAIDLRFDDEATRRQQAAMVFVEMAQATADEEPYEDAATLKDLYDAELAAHQDRVFGSS